MNMELETFSILFYFIYFLCGIIYWFIVLLTPNPFKWSESMERAQPTKLFVTFCYSKLLIWKSMYEEKESSEQLNCNWS